MEKSILYINACVRKDSRTEELAKHLLLKLDRPYEEVRLQDITFPTVNEDYLNMRERLISQGELDHPAFRFAQQFSRAETIVIAAPFWDLSFPAALKQYLEQISVVGITFRYSENGEPIGLCKADKLFYVTTAGGTFVPHQFGFGYVKALAEGLYGIKNVQSFCAAGLDILGADINAIMHSAKANISAFLKKTCL